MCSSRSQLLTLFFLLSATVATVQGQSPQYTVTDLGPFFYPSAINDSGQIVGANIHGRSDAILYSEGVATNITPPDGASARAWGINNFGDVVGEVLFCDIVNGNCVNDRTRAFIYSSSNKTFNILGTLGGRTSRAFAINDAGQVTGYSDIAPGSSVTHAFIFKDGVFKDIGAGSGANDTLAASINASGQVAGYASSNTSNRGAFFYDNNSFLFFEPRGFANDLNNRGEIVGGISGNDDGTGRAFLFNNGIQQDLGTLNGGIYAKANAINNGGQIVGLSSPNLFSAAQRAFIYTEGLMQDLNTLVPAMPGRVLTSAADINDAGQIVTNGQLNGEDHGFLLTPMQPMLLAEPTTNRVIAVQSVFFLRDPFTITTTHNLVSDTRTRLNILVRNMESTVGENLAPPTVHAEDSTRRIIPLPVEFVGKVPKFSWLTQVIVRLPPELEAAGELQLTVTFRGRTSNKSAITILATEPLAQP
jgi:probable HAF family extracellular repeat protein